MLTGDGSEQEKTGCSVARQTISHTHDAGMQMDILAAPFDKLVFFWSLN